MLGFDNCSKNLWNNVNFLEGNFRSEREPGSLSRDALRNPVGGTWGWMGWGDLGWDTRGTAGQGTPVTQDREGEIIILIFICAGKDLVRPTLQKRKTNTMRMSIN